MLVPLKFIQKFSQTELILNLFQTFSNLYRL